MAKATTVKIRLVSEEGTGYFYVTKKNSRTMTDKLAAGRLRQQLTKLERIYGAGGKIPLIPFSAVTNEGRKELWKVIEKHVREVRRAPKR